MLRALHDHHAIVGRVGADGAERIGMERLIAPRADRHVDMLRRQQSHVAERRHHRPVGLEDVAGDLLHRDIEIDRLAADAARLAAQPHAQPCAFARFLGDLEGHRIPHHAEQRRPDLLVDQRLQQESRIARCARARVVGTIGQHQRALVVRSGAVHCLGDGQVPGGVAVAVGPQLFGKLPGEPFRLGLVAIGHDQRSRADVFDIGEREAVAQRHRQDAVLALQRLHAHHELADRRHRGAVLRDHAAIVARHHGAHLAVDRVGDDREQFGRTLHRVGVRVFLVADQHVGAVEHQLREMAMQIELGADRDLGSDDRANALEQVAFAIVVTVGDHGAMHVDQHGVERHCGLHPGEDLVTEALVHRAHGGSRRGGEGAQPFDHGPALLLGFLAPGMDGRGEVGRLVLRGVAAKDAVLLIAAQAGREGHELVGLGAERTDVNALAQTTTPGRNDSPRRDRRPCRRPA